MEESRTAVVAAFLGNLALAVLKGVGATLTGSAAMLAETFHSIADTGNQILLFVGLRLGERPADHDHPFGHGKNVYFWSFVVSVLLFTVGGAFSIAEAVHKLRSSAGAVSQSALWTYGVLAGGFVFEAFSITVALRSLARVKGEATLREFWRDTRDPTLLTVILEDGGALLSLAIATTGITLDRVTGAGVWDAAASAAIGVVLLSIAVLLGVLRGHTEEDVNGVENHSLLIGEAAPRAVEDRIRRAAAADADVERVVELHTMHVGPRAILVVIAVQFRRHLTADQITDAVGRIERAVGRVVPKPTSGRLIVVEPARADAASLTHAA
jgi:cation diffusion facilitator family transporter